MCGLLIATPNVSLAVHCAREAVWPVEDSQAQIDHRLLVTDL